MKWNASLLTLLTVSTDTGEEVFLAYLKQLHEVAPRETYWYDKRGRNGEAGYLWAQQKIKQWLLVGADAEVELIWKHLLENQRYEHRWTNGRHTIFTMPTMQALERNEAEFNQPITGICECSPPPVYYQSQRHLPSIISLIGEENNCNYIEGYQAHDTIKPVHPAGLFPENSLYRYLKEKVVGLHQTRALYYRMREKTLSNTEVLFTGFVQEDAQFREAHYIELRNGEGTDVIGTSDIDTATGKWKVTSSDTSGHGQFIIVDRQTGQPLCGEYFTILRKVSIKHQAVPAVLTDLYGRRISIFEKLQPPKKEAESLNWDANVYPDLRQAEIELSDKIANVLLQLGTDIIISDPYFWGDFKILDDNQLNFGSTGQRIFINALITAMGMGNIETLTLVGRWKHASGYVDGDRPSMVARYKRLLDAIQKTYATIPEKKLRQFSLVFCNKPFHDRYWLSNSLTASDIVCYHISNSVSGLFERQELSIQKQTGISSFKEKTKIHNRISNADVENLL